MDTDAAEGGAGSGGKFSLPFEGCFSGLGQPNIFLVKITFDRSKTIIRLFLVTRTIKKIRFCE
jgi:hypothetical protein